MIKMHAFGLCLFALLKVISADEYSFYPPHRPYFPPATSYGVPIHVIEVPNKPITSSFTYDIPKETAPVHDSPFDTVEKPHQVYGVPTTPKPILPIYGVPTTAAPKPSPIKVVYDFVATDAPKPTISHVYGIPSVTTSKPIQVVYEESVNEAPKPIPAVYGLPPVVVPKPKPIPAVYGLPPVVVPKPKPITVVYDLPIEVPKPVAPFQVYGVPTHVKDEFKPFPILYAPYS